MRASQVDVKRVATEDDERSSSSWLCLPFSERRVLLFLVDTFIINGSVVAAFWGWQALNGRPFGWEFVVSHWRWFPVLSVAWVSLAWLFDLYEIDLTNRRLAVVQQVLITMAALVVLYMVLYFFMPPSVLPRLFVLVFAVLASILLAFWRWGYAIVFTLPHMQRRMLIVGAGWAGRALVEMLREQDNEMYQIVGFVDDDESKQTEIVAGLPVLGHGDQLLKLVEMYRVDKIILAITGEIRGDLFQALVDCRAKGLQVTQMPDFYERVTRQVPVEHINMGWILGTMSGFMPVSRWEQFAKRVTDLVLGGLGLLVLVFITPLVALAIALDDGGPVFYRQIRAGKAGLPYRVIKFRTMRTDAEQEGVPQWACEHDNRVTRVGKLLRKTRLDELPQVINVLRGKMSIVGPRPERPAFIAELEDKIPFYRTRLTVKPGLTGWAQIKYKYGNSVHDSLMKLQYDLYYIRHRSLWLDLYIILKTVGVMLRLEGV